MHEVSRFYGIVIKLFFGGNPPAHFYAVNEEKLGLFDLTTMTMVEGDLNELSQQMVVAWAQVHKQQLLEMWCREECSQLPPLQ